MFLPMLAIFINNGPLIWVNYNDLTVLPHWEWWLVRESSQYGRKIQVSEILINIIIYPDWCCFMNTSPIIITDRQIISAEWKALTDDERRFFFSVSDAGDVGISSLKMVHSC